MALAAAGLGEALGLGDAFGAVFLRAADTGVLSSLSWRKTCGWYLRSQLYAETGLWISCCFWRSFSLSSREADGWGGLSVARPRVTSNFARYSAS